MTDVPQTEPDPDNWYTIDFFAYWASAKRHWRLIGLIALAAILLAAMYLHFATQKYTVTMEVTSADGAQDQLGGKLGALGSLAGISLQGSGSEFKVYQDTLQSPIAAELLAGHQEILIGLFPNEWSDSEHAWREPPSLIRPVANFFKRLLGINVQPWSPPSAYRVFNYLRSELRVS